MKNSEILEETAEVLETYGWIQGSQGNIHTGFCLLGAIGHVFVDYTGISGQDLFVDKVWQAITALQEACPEAAGVITKFNDVKLASKQEAVDVLIKGAKYWRDRGM